MSLFSLHRFFTLFARVGEKSVVFSILYMVLISLLSSIPDNDSTVVSSFLQMLDPTLQNMLHIPLFGGLALLWVLSLHNWPLAEKSVLYAGFIISSIYSLVDEAHQFLVPGRYPGLIDIILNNIGVTLAVLWCYYSPNQVESRED